MNETIRLDDMRLFARVAEARSFTAAAAQLGIPKQTLSRRVADLERALGVRLMHRTTRRLQLTDVGAAYAARCAEITRMAEEAQRAVVDTHETPRGTLRVTADPLFGEAFLAELVVDYATRFPEVRVEVILTRRKVDLLEEGFDVAFRVGHVDDPTLAGSRLGPARIRYCASPAYAKRRGRPRAARDLAEHDLIVISDGGPARWPLPGDGAPVMTPVVGRITTSSFALARRATLAGVGIGLFPEFACADGLREGTLVPVLGGAVVDVGAVWIVHAARRFLGARVRAFVDLARERFAGQPPWSPPASTPAAAGRRARRVASPAGGGRGGGISRARK